jgi:hypothetical protein
MLISFASDHSAIKCNKAIESPPPETATANLLILFTPKILFIFKVNFLCKKGEKVLTTVTYSGNQERSSATSYININKYIAKIAILKLAI